MEKGKDLKLRTEKFAVDIALFCEQLPGRRALNVYSNQLLRASSSVGANYRSALRARSKADFISKITIAEEEADETCYWLEIMIEIEVFPKKRMELLLKEAQEITAILTTAGKTAKEKQIRK